MDDLNRPLRGLGEKVAGASDRAADPTTLDRARRRFMAPAAAPRPRRHVLAALAATIALGLLALVWIRRPRAAIAFEVGAPPAHGAVGEWVAAGDAPVAVRFSDGTAVTLAPGGRLRVTEADAAGASMLIERGALHAVVVHAGRDTRWSILAGPFAIRVTGTTFDAAWDPATETLRVHMEEGAVRVEGPEVPPERTVVAGEDFVISARDGRMALTTARAAFGDPATPASSAAALPAVAEPICAEPSRAAPASSAIAAATSPPAWKALAAAGKYRDAVEAAERPGFRRQIDHATGGDLLLLADAARFAGRPARAREALLAFRSRPGPRGATAFLLGKIAADQAGASAEAVTWFETYLREEPSGALADQALGRILELERRRDPTAARELAARYVAKYPNGAYAPLARSLVSP
jgi:transmembrane sensor